MVLGVVVALGGCDGSSSPAQAPAPGRAPPTRVPDPAHGKALFEANCAQCHGADMRGTVKGPPLLHPYYRPAHHADIAFYWAVEKGVRQHHWHFGDMPPVPGLSRADVADIIDYVRQSQRSVGIR
jgi:mono/diheme cytochrome c family protein